VTRVAVVVPVYREPIGKVRRTLASILATSNVTEAILVDDGCNAAELDDLIGERVRVLHLPKNGGCSAALNAGIATLDDEDIACRLDVGDHFYPEAKARQIDVVLSGQARCSSSTHFDPVSGEVWKMPQPWHRRIFTDSVFVPCTNVYRVSVWREVGGHDETLRYKADWDFSMIVQFYVGWHMHPEVTCEAGMYPDGFTAQALADPVKRAVREECNRIVSERARVWGNPDAHAHLFNPKWCRKRGIEPLRRPEPR
jgi:glycosyltransferase involved in cell wall biosynthesis